MNNIRLVCRLKIQSMNYSVITELDVFVSHCVCCYYSVSLSICMSTWLPLIICITFHYLVAPINAVLSDQAFLWNSNESS